MIQEATRNLIT